MPLPKPDAVLVTGPAGAGKSTFCASLITHAQSLGRTVHLFNLDPAADKFEYPPSIDIKDLVSLEDVMDELQLGPNGGLIYCFECASSPFRSLPRSCPGAHSPLTDPQVPHAEPRLVVGRARRL